MNAIPMGMDPSGNVATAATSLVGTFNNYFTGTASTTPTLTDATSALVTELKKATASNPTASDAINVVDNALTGSHAPSGTTVYAIVEADSTKVNNGETSDMLYHLGMDAWVQVVTDDDLAGLAAKLLND